MKLRAYMHCAALALMPAMAHAADQFSTLASFASATGPTAPASDLAIDGKGNVYGATSTGGPDNLGTIYELSPPAAGQTSWTQTVLWNFTTAFNKDEHGPDGGLIRDKGGNLYGVFYSGGNYYCGGVFRLRQHSDGWHYKILYEFHRHPNGDGCNPMTALTLDGSGNLYGGTYNGGVNNEGTVFKLTPPADDRGRWTESLLWSFYYDTDGLNPTQMIFDKAGNLYGASSVGYGGASNGTVWQLVPPAAGNAGWTRNIIWTFDGTTGTAPAPGPMVFDAQGNLYGSCSDGGTHKSGTVFKLTPPAAGATQWTASVIYNFTGKADGGTPTSGVTMTRGGTLLIPTKTGGSGGAGTITELIPPPVQAAPGRRMYWSLSMAPTDQTPNPRCCWAPRARSSAPPIAGRRPAIVTAACGNCRNSGSSGWCAVHAHHPKYDHKIICIGLYKIEEATIFGFTCGKRIVRLAVRAVEAATAKVRTGTENS